MTARSFVAVALCIAAAPTALCASEIKHAFVATDESGKQLVYVKQGDPTKEWSVPLKGNRDLQITKDGTVVVSVPDGYREYRLDGGTLVKDVKAGDRIQSVVRLDNGHTLLASKKKVIELDANDKTVSARDMNFGGLFRLLRMSREGNLIYTSGKTTISERTQAGTVVRTVDVAKLAPGASKPYAVEQTADGTIVVSTGFGGSVLLLDRNWKLTKVIGGKGKIKGLETFFFADVYKLKNGNIVVAHWTGHGRKDSNKAPQAVELDPDGNMVWSWHDPKRAGTFHGIEVIE
jgi:outer membrane protein assembly factor BamB